MSMVCLRCEHYDYDHRPRADIYGGDDGLSFANVDPDDDACAVPGCRCTPFTDHPGTGEPSGPGHNRPDSPLARDGYGNVGEGWGGKGGYGDRPKVGPWREFHLAGWQAPPTRPAVVADFFGGVGTTAMVARALGRVGLSFDLSHPYSRAANWRIFDSGQHGKATARTWAERQGTLT